MTEEKEWNHIERIITNLNQHWHSIQLLLGYVSKPLLVDDRGLSEVIRQMSITLRSIIDEIKDLDLVRINGELNFIGKKLHVIEEAIISMQKQGVTKKIELDFIVDGYEMVKKPVMHDKTLPIEPSRNESYENLFDSLTPAEGFVLKHRFGLLKEKKKTLKATGDILKKSQERIRQIEARALRKCRHSIRKKLVDKIKGTELYMAIRGE